MLERRIEYLVFIDESHFISVDQWKQYGWYEHGTYPLAFWQNLFQKQSCSLLMAIGYPGLASSVVSKQAKSRGVKQLQFLDFLLDLQEKLSLNYIFIMGNAKVHKSELVKSYVRAMEQDGRIVLFEAKYSPELNPELNIHLVFSKEDQRFILKYLEI